MIQLTLEGNYQRYTNQTGTDIVTGENYSKVATDMAIAADTAGFYWKKSRNGININSVADKNRTNADEVTSEINAASKAKNDRQEAFNILKNLYDIDECLKC